MIADSGQSFEVLSESHSATIEVTSEDPEALQAVLEMKGYTVKKESNNIWQLTKTVQ